MVSISVIILANSLRSFYARNIVFKNVVQLSSIFIKAALIFMINLIGIYKVDLNILILIENKITLCSNTSKRISIARLM